MTQLLQDFLEDNVWFFVLSFAILCCIVSDTNYSLFFFWKTLSIVCDGKVFHVIR